VMGSLGLSKFPSRFGTTLDCFKTSAVSRDTSHALSPWQESLVESIGLWAAESEED